MRWTALAVLLSAGCPSSNNAGNECTMDTQCGDFVCARDGVCTPASDVRQVKATWTIRGMAASATTCTSPDLYIQFDSNDINDTLGFLPVPCIAGQFNVDKLPRRFIQVELGRDAGDILDIAVIDPQTGLAMLDIFL